MRQTAPEFSVVIHTENLSLMDALRTMANHTAGRGVPPFVLDS